MTKQSFFAIWILITAIATPSIRADEGMWIPLLIEKYNINLMQEKGFKLNADDIYSVNRACMKDAVIIFGGGCSGGLISPEGLVLTNHHCGYSNIQRHSSLENDYLTDGFWAMSKEEELPNPGLTVTILRYMEDVTEKVLSGVAGVTDQSGQAEIIRSNIRAIREKAVEGTGYSASVRPFYMGNQYFLFVDEIFRDVRLVGAPPSAIGKFGGETDNWVWPRHTCDFSLFRVYAGKDNKPAAYSEDNIPYKPLYFFPLSLKGVNEGDFTMVFGYPGNTSQYLPSYYIDMVKNYINPEMIAVRTEKIRIMEEAINTGALLRLQYSAKKSGLANSWKRWIGENQGLERMNTIGKKQEFEAQITAWIETDEARKLKYGHILPAYKELYSVNREYNIVNNFTNEVMNGVEAINLAGNLRELIDLIEKNAKDKETGRAKAELLAYSKGFFRNYDKETDRKLFISLMKLYGEKLDPRWQTPQYIKMKSSVKGNYNKAADKMYSRTVFADEAQFISFIEKFDRSSASRIRKDPFYLLAVGAGDLLATRVRPELTRLNAELAKLNRDYMQAQMEYEKGKVFYPDANSTLRVSYGTVKGYFARDAVYFTHLTTIKGIIEKDDPGIYDYDVPEKLKELFHLKDFGRYARDGDLPVCFIANNHTTGGNSGSPVINAEGHLIGINFDRAWEGVASDVAFNPEQSRNISLDIRYVLFIIDKFAGAGYLLNEMTLID